jgi:hypothetical protein
MVGAVVLVAVVRADGVLDVAAAGLVAVFVPADAGAVDEALVTDVRAVTEEPPDDDPAPEEPAEVEAAADAVDPPLPAAFWAPAFLPEPLTEKKSRQMGSTLCGSARNC